MTLNSKDAYELEKRKAKPVFMGQEQDHVIIEFRFSRTSTELAMLLRTAIF